MNLYKFTQLNRTLKKLIVCILISVTLSNLVLPIKIASGEDASSTSESELVDESTVSEQSSEDESNEEAGIIEQIVEAIFSDEISTTSESVSDPILDQSSYLELDQVSTTSEIVSDSIFELASSTESATTSVSEMIQNSENDTASSISSEATLIYESDTDDPLISLISENEDSIFATTTEIAVIGAKLFSDQISEQEIIFNK